MSRSRLRGDFAVVKALASIQPGPAGEEGPGTFSLILSTDDLDRDDEVVDPGAFEPLPDHIAMDIDHGMSVATTVGSGPPYYAADGTLRIDGTYASTELGQNTRTLVREGHIRTASVAMIPLKKTKDADGVTHITKADLLNAAFTPVPSNKNAKVLSSKSAAKVLDEAEALLKAGRRNSTPDQAILQTIHDLTANLGAICGNGSSEEGGSAGDVDNDGATPGVHPLGRFTRSAPSADTKTTEDVDTKSDAETDGKSAAQAADVKSATDAADTPDDLDAVIASAAAAALRARIA